MSGLVGQCTLLQALFFVEKDPCCQSGDLGKPSLVQRLPKALTWTTHDISRFTEIPTSMPSGARMKSLSYVDSMGRKVERRRVTVPNLDHELHESRIDGKVVSFSIEPKDERRRRRVTATKTTAAIEAKTTRLLRAPNGTVYLYRGNTRRRVPSFRILKQHLDGVSLEVESTRQRIRNVSAVELARIPVTKPLEDLDTRSTAKSFVGRNPVAVDGFSTSLNLPTTFHVGSSFVLSMWIWPWRIHRSETSYASRFTSILSSSAATGAPPLTPTILIDSHGGRPRLFFSILAGKHDLKGMFSKQTVPTREWTHVALVCTGSQFLGLINGVVDSAITVSSTP